MNYNNYNNYNDYNNDFYEDPYSRNYDSFGLSYYSEPWRTMRREMRRLGDSGFERNDRGFGRYFGRDVNDYDNNFGRYYNDRSLMDRDFGRNYPVSHNWERSVMPFSQNLERSVMPFSQDWERSLMPSSQNFFSPKWDITENESNICINAEIPGLTRDQIHIDVDQNNRLHVFGDKASKYEDKNNRIHRIERSFGSFRRTLGLPEGVDPQNIQASYENGQLRITIPKSFSRQQQQQGLNRPVNISDRSLNQGSTGINVNQSLNQPSSQQSTVGKEHVVGQQYGNQPQYSKTDLPSSNVQSGGVQQQQY